MRAGGRRQPPTLCFGRPATACPSRAAIPDWRRSLGGALHATVTRRARRRRSGCAARWPPAPSRSIGPLVGISGLGPGVAARDALRDRVFWYNGIILIQAREGTVAKDLILAIDNGTQSVRALLFDLKRQPIVAEARAGWAVFLLLQPGWAEQDPVYFWDALCRACQQLWQQSPVPKEAIAGGADHAALNSDQRGSQPASRLRPAIVWLDQRRTYGLKPVGGLWGWLSRLPGMTRNGRLPPGRGRGRTGSARTSPTSGRSTHKYLFLSGYLTYRLTGRFVDSVGCQVGYMPFDYKTAALGAAQRLEVAGRARWTRPLLPDLVPPAGRLGEISAEAAAKRPASRPGLPLIAAAADKACEVIGAGCLDPHIGCLSYGTTATINTTHRKYVEVIPLIPPYPAAVPGRLQPGDPGLPRLLDGKLVQAGVRLPRTAPRRGARRRAGGAVRRPGGAGAARLDGADAATLLVARAEIARPGGQGRDHRLRRRAHPRAPLPGHPGRAGLRAARGQGAHGKPQRRARSPSCACPVEARRAMPRCS